MHRLAPGDVVELDMPGGGGFGDPLEREPELVLADVRAGLVSLSAARSDYGVVLLPLATAVDGEATAQLRRSLRERRGSG